MSVTTLQFVASIAEGFDAIQEFNILPFDDATLENSVGNWVSNANAVVTRTVADFYQGLASLSVVSAAAGAYSAHLNARPRVDPGRFYLFTARVKAPGTTNTIRAEFVFKDAGGVQIGAAIQGPTIVSSAAYQEIVTAAIAPDTAASVDVLLRMTVAAGGAGETHYFDGMALVPGIKPNALVNNILNANDASFETDVTGWASTITNCTVARDTAQHYDGVAAMKMTAVGAGAMSITHSPTGLNAFPVDANQLYLCAVRGYSTLNAKNLQANIRWYDAAGALISTSSVSHSNVQNTWSNALTLARAPANAVTAQASVGVATALAGGDVFWFDTVIFDAVENLFRDTSPVESASGFEFAPWILLDLNDGDTFTFLQNPDFSPPQIRRSISSSMLVDGGQVAALAADNRVLDFRELIDTANEDSLAAQLTALARELERPTNILKFQSRSATKPVYFRTFASPDYDLQQDPMKAGQATVHINILAEPFAYGLREDISLANATIASDPAAAANGCFIDVEGIIGDSPTPLLIEGAPHCSWALFATRRHGNPANLSWFTQAEAMTQRTDTATQPNDVLMSGAGNNFSRTTFAIAADDVRLTTPALLFGANTKVADAIGTYRIFARVRKSAAGTTGDMQLYFGVFPTGGGSEVFSDPVNLPAAAGPMLIDLGLIQIPPGEIPPAVGFSSFALNAYSLTFDFFAKRVSGALTLDWDFVIAVPADEELMIMSSSLSPGNDFLTWDGPNDMILQSDISLFSGGALKLQTSRGRAGKIPMLTPGVPNRILTLIGDFDGTSINHSFVRTLPVTLRYWPRYLTVRT